MLAGPVFDFSVVIEESNASEKGLQTASLFPVVQGVRWGRIGVEKQCSSYSALPSLSEAVSRVHLLCQQQTATCITLPETGMQRKRTKGQLSACPRLEGFVSGPSAIDQQPLLTCRQ